MSEQTAKLLPCPFCGGEAEIERYGDARESTQYGCTMCGCTLETGEEWGHGRRWNEREPSPGETQASITAWADTVFGQHQGPVPPLLRAINELVEACIAAGISEKEVMQRVQGEFARQFRKGAIKDLSNLPAEVAGTAIVLFRVAQAGGFDLQDAINTEMQKNRGRQWFAKGDGTGHHIPAALPPADGGAA